LSKVFYCNNRNHGNHSNHGNHRKEFPMLTFNVQDMTCNHCAGAITRAVKEVDADASVAIDVTAKRVEIDSKLAAAALAEAIKEAGYTPLAV
jgi:copper chaperone